jgi:uncharacterized protein YcfJ
MAEEAQHGVDRSKTKDGAEKIKEIGGLVAVLAGLVAVAAVAGGALIVGSQTGATIAGSAAAAIGSMVGAYFGVKVGTDQTKDAVKGQREEAAKAQVFAAHLPEGKAEDVVKQVTEVAKAFRGGK